MRVQQKSNQIFIKKINIQIQNIQRLRGIYNPQHFLIIITIFVANKQLI